LVFQAYHNGLTVKELDPSCVHYHIEHDYGSGWTPEGAGSLWTRLDERGIPYMSYDQFTELVYEMQDNAAQNVFTVYNGLDWGFANEELDDRPIVVAGTNACGPSKVNDFPLTEDFFAHLKRIELWETNWPVIHFCARVETLTGENGQ